MACRVWYPGTLSEDARQSKSVPGWYINSYVEALRMSPVLYSIMCSSESVFCLHESQDEKLIGSVHSFFNGVLLCKSSILKQNFQICLYNNLLHIPYNIGSSSSGICKENALIYMIYLLVIQAMVYSVAKPVLAVMTNIDRLSKRQCCITQSQNI